MTNNTPAAIRNARIARDEAATRYEHAVMDHHAEASQDALYTAWMAAEQRVEDLERDMRYYHM